MIERVDCPVCRTTTASDAYAAHLADAHLRTGLRERYGYSALWAGVLALIAVAVLAVQISVIVGPVSVRAVLTAVVHPRTVNEWLVDVSTWLVLPLATLALAWTTTAIVRGPGQSIRHGWRPTKREYRTGCLWAVPLLGPAIYLVGASRRWIAVRYAREKTTAVVANASKLFADADRALDERRDRDAADAFRDVAARIHWLLDDENVARAPTGDDLATLQAACELAVDVHEDRTD